MDPENIRTCGQREELCATTTWQVGTNFLYGCTTGKYLICSRIPDPMDTELGSCGFTNIRLSTRSQWTCRKPLENEVGKNLLGKAGHTACDCGQRERRLEVGADLSLLVYKLVSRSWIFSPAGGRPCSFGLSSAIPAVMSWGRLAI